MKTILKFLPLRVPYFIRNVYGVSRMYIADIQLANTIAKLTEQRTLSETHKQALTDLGFEFVQVNDHQIPASADCYSQASSPPHRQWPTWNGAKR